jgi:hypothetical protein
MQTTSDHKHEPGAYGVCKRCGLEKSQHVKRALDITSPLANQRTRQRSARGIKVDARISIERTKKGAQ